MLKFISIVSKIQGKMHKDCSNVFATKPKQKKKKISNGNFRNRLPLIRHCECSIYVFAMHIFAVTLK